MQRIHKNPAPPSPALALPAPCLFASPASAQDPAAQTLQTLPRGHEEQGARGCSEEMVCVDPPVAPRKR